MRTNAFGRGHVILNERLSRRPKRAVNVGSFCRVATALRVDGKRTCLNALAILVSVSGAKRDGSLDAAANSYIAWEGLTLVHFETLLILGGESGVPRRRLLYPRLLLF